jgi:hypothetical protein
MEKEVKPKEKKNNKEKKVRKYTRLDLLFGCFKGQIFGDDSIFNLEMKPDAILR